MNIGEGQGDCQSRSGQRERPVGSRRGRCSGNGSAGWRFARNAGNRADETIAESRYCFDVARRSGRIAESPPQPVGGSIEPAFEIHERAGGPEFAAKLFACYQLTRLGHQSFKNLQRLDLQLDLYAVLEELARPGV
jgi:hypothetical protein